MASKNEWHNCAFARPGRSTNVPSYLKKFEYTHPPNKRKSRFVPPPHAVSEAQFYVVLLSCRRRCSSIPRCITNCDVYTSRTSSTAGFDFPGPGSSARSQNCAELAYTCWTKVIWSDLCALHLLKQSGSMVSMTGIFRGSS